MFIVIIQKYSLPYLSVNWLTDYKKVEIFDLDKCAELDGSILGFKIKNYNQEIEENLPLNIDCFIGNEYSSTFLQQLSHTINKFRFEKF